jgi:methylphosphotriester-DNA--protein-cysteine methyltransferase
MRYGRSVVIPFAMVFLLSTAAYAFDYRASRKSNKYHLPSCKWAQKIKPGNLIIFNSPEKALKAGYVPCKVCRPPVDSRTGMEDTLRRTSSGGWRGGR